jgi:hypothetical protein
MFLSARIKIVTGVAALVSMFALVLSPVVANADSSAFHLGYYTPSGRTLSMSDTKPGNGLASFNFTNQANTALLVENQTANSRDLSNASVNAKFDISGLTGAFTYYGEPDGSGAGASVRYYFETANTGGFNEAHYWWSNPVAVKLTSNGTFTLPPVSLSDGSQWSDFYGHAGNDPSYSAEFTAATQNVTKVGLSFGGGFFFENGVGTTDGSGTFTLDSFSAQ